MEENKNGKPLTNADFRKILFTPRPGAGKPDLAQQAKERAKAAAAADSKKERRQRPPRPKPSKQEKGSGDDAEVDRNAYRDRATERRRGLDADDDAAVLGSSTATHLAGISYEDSKFLGGDVAHTHLVKGLDYALLTRIRSEQQQKQQQQGAPVDEEDNEEAAAMQPSSDGRPLPPQNAAVTFATPLGRALYESLVEQQRQAGRPAAAAERFLPRRTAFVFDLEAADPRQVPTTLLRAKEDCPPPPKVLPASADAAVLERLAHILAYVQVGGSGMKKMKKAQKQELAAAAQDAALPPPPAAAAAGPVDEDEDIFADAGTDYVAERRRATAADEGAGPPALETGKRAYFQGPSALEEEAAAVVGPSAADTAAAFAEAEAAKREAKKKEKEREGKRREMLEAAADDGYAECYPSYFDAAGMVYDSEDDDGTGAAKKKAAAEEEEAAAAAAAAAAAMAPGDAKKDAKKGGGSSNARREAYKLAMKDKAKQEAELNKLQKVFEEKGYGNADAFVETKSGGGKDREREPASAVEEEDVAARAPVKKRRI